MSGGLTQEGHRARSSSEAQQRYEALPLLRRFGGRFAREALGMRTTRWRSQVREASLDEERITAIRAPQTTLPHDTIAEATRQQDEAEQLVFTTVVAACQALPGGIQSACSCVKSRLGGSTGPYSAHCVGASEIRA